MSLDIVVCMTQVWQASQDIQPIFAGIDQLVGQNIRRVQSAMQRQRIGPHHFSGSTGYGHGDLGREAFDSVSPLLSRQAGLGYDLQPHSLDFSPFSPFFSPPLGFFCFFLLLCWHCDQLCAGPTANCMLLPGASAL